MSDLERERAMVRQCAKQLRETADLIDAAVKLNMAAALDWPQIIRYLNEGLINAASSSMWDDPEKHVKLYRRMLQGAKAMARELA